MHHWLGLTFFFVLSVVSVVLLAQLSRRTQQNGNSLIEDVNRCMPQTQCGQCGYPGCRPYSTAIIEEGAPINRCPPGGDDTIQALANLLGRDPLPLAEDLEEAPEPRVAIIREDACIGCVKCIKACPVDAIIGRAKRMHTVIPDLCTGCELCIPPCPVDCIDMVPLETTPSNWRPALPTRK